MDFLRLPNETWHDFFDGMTDLMRGKLVELDVVGLDLGVAVEDEWVVLQGITYEPREDTLYIFTEAGPSEHAIARPRQIFVELGAAGVNQVVVIDDEDRKHLMRLRTPLELPRPHEPAEPAPAAGP